MIHFVTTVPRQLREAFEATVKAGHITTWKDTGHGYYTHSAERWRVKALLTFSLEATQLRANFLRVEGNCPVSERTAVFAYYQGHLAETFMNHFSGVYSQSVLTAAPDSGDTGFK